jgi:hypothetical protein
VIGSACANVIEPVALMLATDGKRVDADAAAMEVLRALEIVEQERA